MVQVHGDADWLRRYVDARDLVSRASSDEEIDSTAGLLRGLCRGLTSALEVAGAAVNLMSDTGSHGVAAASDERSRYADELQFTTGDGPCHEAFVMRRPVLTPDLRSVPGERWPGYCAAALTFGVAAVFAFPLYVGAAGLGVLDLYLDRPGSLSPRQEADALIYAQIATEILLDGGLVTPEGDLEPGLSTALDSRAEIYQAQGMVVVDLEVNPAEALARMRAHAFAHDQPLIELARAIVAGSKLPADP